MKNTLYEPIKSRPRTAVAAVLCTNRRMPLTPLECLLWAVFKRLAIDLREVEFEREARRYVTAKNSGFEDLCDHLGVDISEARRALLGSDNEDNREESRGFNSVCQESS